MSSSWMPSPIREIVAALSYDPSTGKVIGIVNAVFVKESKESLLQKPSGISYAIPINFARELMKKADQ